MTTVVHGCTDQHFALSMVTLHDYGKLFMEHTILGILQQCILHFGQSGCGTSMCVCVCVCVCGWVGVCVVQVCMQV